MSRRRVPPAQFSIQHFHLRGSQMQVISRRENEGLVIGEEIFITVLLIRDDFVRLAICCPRLTPSYWEETLFLATEEASSRLQLSGAHD
jgi:carbon storage regulator CsrA